MPCQLPCVQCRLKNALFFNYAVPITQFTSLRKRNSAMPLSIAVEQSKNKLNSGFQFNAPAFADF